MQSEQLSPVAAAVPLADLPLRELLDGLNAHVALLDIRGTILYVNAAWRSFADANHLRASAHGIGLNYLHFCDHACGDDALEARAIAAGMRAVLAGRSEQFWAQYACHSVDERRWFQMRLRPLRLGERRLFAVSHENVTELKRAEEALKLAELSLESASLPILWCDAAGCVARANPAAHRLFGYEPRAMAGRPLTSLISDDALPARIAHLPFRSSLSCETGARRADGGVTAVELTLAPVGQGFTAFVQDISERQQADAQIWRLAYSDQLTGLPNRAFAQMLLSEGCARAQEAGRCYSLLLLDLDYFKSINDSLGMHTGDSLLKSVADRVRQEAGTEALLARVGGDAFVVGLTDDHAATAARTLASRLLGSLMRPHALEGTELSISASIGTSLFPADGATADDLLRAAEMAMYWAKERGRNQAGSFEPHMAARSQRRMQLESALRQALPRAEFTLHYQIQFAAESRRPCGVEALLRWQSRELGAVSPAEFIPVAERQGLIHAIGEWVLEAAVAQAAAWRRAGLPTMRVAVNVSAHQFHSRGFAPRVLALLAREGLDPAWLELEITESVLLDDGEVVRETIAELHRHGVGVAVDDFGTGYSSLSYLRKLAIDRLKIDRSFITEVPACGDACAIVEAVMGMSRALGMQVVAEGVESEPQLDFLRRSGCQMVQGYLLARPAPAAEVTSRLQGAGA